MMGKSAPSMPAPPDPNVTAAAQSQANIDAARATAELNRTNQVTPYGNVTWSQAYSPQDQAQLDQYDQDYARWQQDLSAWQADPGTVQSRRQVGIDEYGLPRFDAATASNPRPVAPDRPQVYPSQWTQTVSLTPQGQANLDLQNGLTNAALSFGQEQLARVAGTAAQPFGFGDAPPQVTGVPPTIAAAAATGAGAQPGARYQPGSAMAGLEALGRELQASGGDARTAQARYLGGLAPQGLAEILASGTGRGMLLGNIGDSLQQRYGAGSGTAVQRLQQLGAELQASPGADVHAAQRALLANMSGGDIADLLRAPEAGGGYGPGFRQELANRLAELAMVPDRPDQGAGAIQRSLPTGGLPPLPTIAPMLPPYQQPPAGPITQGQSGSQVQPQAAADPYQTALQRQRVEDALYQRATARLDPYWQTQQQALESRLAAQGIPVGSEAHDAEWDRFDRARTDAYGQARDQALLAGGDEQSRLFGLGLAGRQQGFNELLAGGQFANAAQAQAYGQASNTRGQLFNEQMAGRQQAFTEGMTTAQQAYYQALQNAQLQNAARQQAIQEQLLARNQPINELAALLGVSGGVQMPQFGQPAQVGVAPPDLQGAIYNSYQGQVNNRAQQAAAQARQMQGLGNVLGTAGTIAAHAGWLSDRRLKRDVRRVGTGALGLPLYAFRYLWEAAERVGYMADEVRGVAPWAVFRAGPFDAVDYAVLRAVAGPR
ncbi:tail fiber domain-containing protein [Marinibaculum pumilum]|uniref:Tail fiber domain-containing protein n=1 Tax=Marinibaculum pumilum TaxID=1766165 RepID=A0ABV7L995_9PROT